MSNSTSGNTAVAASWNSGAAYSTHLSRYAAVLTMAIGLSVLVGWTLDIPILRSVIPGAVEMKANTALGLVLAGGSLLLLMGRRFTARNSLAAVLAMFAGLIGLATWSEYAFAWDLEIDELLFRDTGRAYNLIPGRMSPYSAIAFAAIALALCCLPVRPLRIFSGISGSFVAIIGAISLTGYFWNAAELVTDKWLPPVAVNSAVGFLLLGLGTLFAIPKFNEEPYAPVIGWSIEAKVLSGFVASMFLLLVGGGFTYRSSSEFAKSADWVAHTQKVRIAVNNLYGLVSNAEVAQRNYLLTGREQLLTEYMDSADRVREQARQTALMTADNRDQVANVERLIQLISIRFNRLAVGIGLFQQNGFEAAREFIRGGDGIETMRKIHELILQMDEIEEKLLIQRQARVHYQSQMTLISILIMIAVAASILALLYHAIRREMAARFKAQGELASANRFLDSIIENLPDLVIIKDAADLRYTRINRAGEELIGYTREEALGKIDHDLFPREEADYFAAKDREALALTEPQDIPEQAFTTRDRGMRFVHTKKIALPGPKGTPAFLLVIAEDVTDRKASEDEIKSLNTALQQRAIQIEASNKELEAFSYSISHDLRAPLRHIQGYIQLLIDSLGHTLEGEPRRYLEVIRKASVQMGDLIDDLLTFSKMGRTSMQQSRIDLDPMVRSTIGDLELAMRGRNVVWKIGRLPAVEGDAAMLKQVFVNLLSNAVKYTGPRDPAEIEVGCAGEENGWAVLFVRDNGVGFDMKYANKLFGVFQRLHRFEEFEGTGIGLANVQRVISRHGGKVWAEAALDRGATFFFTVKLAEAK